MNYFCGADREQIRIESLKDYVGKDSEVRIIDKIIACMKLESLGFKIGNNDNAGRPKFNPRDL